MAERRKIGLLSFLIRFSIGFVWLGFWSLTCMCLMILALPFRTLRVRIGNFCGKMIGPVVSWLIGAKIINPDSEKLNSSKPAIFVSNHASALDVFIGMALCPYGGCGVGRIPPEGVTVDALRLFTRELLGAESDALLRGSGKWAR